MNEQKDMRPAKSEQYRKFEDGLKQVLSMPKEELNRLIEAEKECKPKRKKSAPDSRE